MKVTKITTLYAHVCPLCGRILASSSEINSLPEYSICACDRNTEKIPAYTTYPENGYVMIRRNKYPRFTARVSPGVKSDIENIVWLDECTPEKANSSIKKAIIFLKKSQKTTKM